MSELHEKQPGETYFAEDFNDSFSYILDSMLRLGQDTGSFVSQVNAHFDLFSTATAGSVSTMTWATGSYTCNNALPLLCTIRTPVIYVKYSTAGSQLISCWPLNNTYLGSDAINSNHGSVYNVGSGHIGLSQIGESFIFNGTTSYLRIPSNTNIETDSFTVMAWVKPTTRATGTDPDYVDSIVATDGGADISGGWDMQIDSNGSFHILLNDGTKRDVNSLINVPLNSWSHLAFTFTDGSMYPYVNSVLGNTYISGTFTRNGSPINIGCRSPSASGYEYFFEGSMLQIVYFSRGLSQTEITHIYANGSGMPHTSFSDSVTTAIAKWTGSYSSDTVVQHYLSLDNGTTWTQVTEGKLGSITPNTGSLMSELRLTRTGSNVRDNVTSVGLYYG